VDACATVYDDDDDDDDDNDDFGGVGVFGDVCIDFILSSRI